MNRAAKRVQLFDANKDYIAVEGLLLKAKMATGIRVLDYCIMPNHFHFILWPRAAREMSQFMRRFTGTHAQVWQNAKCSTGSGAVYQGRYKAIPVQTGEYFYNVCRYVERNPLRAGLVARAEEWPWSGLWRRLHGEDGDLLNPWPIPYPSDWLQIVNAPMEASETKNVQRAIKRGIPLGDPDWIAKTAEVVGLKHRLRSRGRPSKQRENCTRPLSLPT
jgi:putative transposase